MPGRASKPSLPPEILVCIVNFVVPSEARLKIAFEASHTITKTLLALTRTARIIYPAARRLLYTHCLYIDSPRRLRRVINPLTAYLAQTITTKSHLALTQSSSPHQTSLYLAPFPHNSIADLNIALDVYDLLSILAPILRRIVTAIPLRSLAEIRDTDGILRILHDGFMKLTSVEFFYSTRDDLFLNYDEEWRAERWFAPSYPSLWPKLKLLAVYNVDIGSDVFWRDVTSLESLETLVLTRTSEVWEDALKREWTRLSENKDRKLTVWCVDVDGGFGIPEMAEGRSEGNIITLRVARVPTSYYGDEDVAELCQSWMKRAALKGEEGFKAELEYLSG